MTLNRKRGENNLVEMNFKHPDYPDSRDYMKVINHSNDKIVSRVQYPDDSIVVFTQTAEGIVLSSNRCILMTSENNIELIPSKVNENFTDVI